MEVAGLADTFEEGCFRSSHPDLSTAFQPGEQGRPALRVEVRGDFIEKKDRRFAPALRHQLRMCEYKPEQQRLLLAGRRTRGRHILGAMRDQQVLSMRPDGRPAGGGVTAAAFVKLRGQVVIFPAFEVYGGAGKLVFRSAFCSLAKLGHRARASTCDGRAMLRHLQFERG